MYNKYSAEFKIKVVKECFEGKDSLRGIAKKYGIKSVSTVREWIAEYQNSGGAGFYTEQRGRSRKAVVTDLDNMTLKEQVEYLKMENAILKKLKALMESK